MDLDQDRISLTELMVIESQSRDNLCFSAKVLFHHMSIAMAYNSGRGGATTLDVLPHAEESFARARAFASTLPPITIESTDSEHPTQKLSVEVTLVILVDSLAERMYIAQTLHADFNREMLNNVLFLKEGRLLSLKGVKLRLISDKPGLFSEMRRLHGRDIVILAELPRAVAFWHWKQCALMGEES
jgi:hypothetical protein